MDPGESYPLSIQHCQTQVIHYPSNIARPRLSIIQPTQSDPGYPLFNQHCQTQVIHYPSNIVRPRLSTIQPTQSDPGYLLSNQHSQTPGYPLSNQKENFALVTRRENIAIYIASFQFYFTSLHTVRK